MSSFVLIAAAIVSQIKLRALRSGIEASAGFSGPRAQPAKASSPEDYLNIYIYFGGPTLFYAENVFELARLICLDTVRSVNTYLFGGEGFPGRSPRRRFMLRGQP